MSDLGSLLEAEDGDPDTVFGLYKQATKFHPDSALGEEGREGEGEEGMGDQKLSVFSSLMGYESVVELWQSSAEQEEVP